MMNHEKRKVNAIYTCNTQSGVYNSGLKKMSRNHCVKFS